MYVPPECPVLKKKYETEEPVRTGFNQGLIPISIKDNREHGRYPLGPEIIVE